MKLGIMQPYFMPYIGYWQLLNAVDKYVVYDDVSYIKGGWINRNNILVQGQKHLFTMSLKEASPNKLINQITIQDDFVKLKKMLQINYAKAPYYNECMSLIDTILSYDKSNLGRFLYNSIQEVARYLQIKNELILSSNLDKNNNLKGKEKVLHICDILKADTYYNAIGGQSLYNKQEFASNGVTLFFLQMKTVEYKQFANEFVPNLSIIDVLMFNSIEQVKEMLGKYTLQ